MKYKNLALFYASLDAALIAACSYFGAIYVLNSQVALACSCMILFASFHGYKKRVVSRADEAAGEKVDLGDEKDEFWDCEIDNSNLNNGANAAQTNSNLNYEKDNSNLKAEKTDEFTLADSEQVARSEGSRDNPLPPSQGAASPTREIENKDKISVSKFELLGAMKPMRLLAYALLIVAFFALERRGLFEPFSFLAGVAVMPLGAFLAGVFQNAKL